MTCITDMSDYSDYSSRSCDEETTKTRNTMANISCKLTPLSFSYYETCGDKKELELAIPISEFDPTKVTLAQCKLNPNNYDILYDGHRFRVFLKAFSEIIKRSRVFEREICVKIKDIAQNKLIWEICHVISTILQELYQQKKSDKFCCYIEWYRIFVNNCDERLARRKVHYFEDTTVALDRVVMIDDNAWTNQYRLVSEMIDTKVLKLTSAHPILANKKEESNIILLK